MLKDFSMYGLPHSECKRSPSKTYFVRVFSSEKLMCVMNDVRQLRFRYFSNKVIWRKENM